MVSCGVPMAGCSCSMFIGPFWIYKVVYYLQQKYSFILACEDFIIEIDYQACLNRFAKSHSY